MSDYTRKPIKESFLDDIASHKMTVVADDGGVCRSLDFSKGSFDQKFQITTWPEYICISGDMGTLVFTRTNDMFDLFRDKSGECRINSGYWGEKLQAGEYKEFSSDKLEKDFRSWLGDRLEDFDYDFDESTIESIVDSCCPDTNTREEAIYYLEDEDQIEITDHDCEIDEDLADEFTIPLQGFIDQMNGDDGGDYKSYEGPTRRYQWLLHAIVWGITQYDQSKVLEVAA